jgi:hypothetical protein
MGPVLTHCLDDSKELKYDHNPCIINKRKEICLGLPYKQEVRGSSPRPPTIILADSKRVVSSSQKMACAGRRFLIQHVGERDSVASASEAAGSWNLEQHPR